MIHNSVFHIAYHSCGILRPVSIGPANRVVLACALLTATACIRPDGPHANAAPGKVRTIDVELVLGCDSALDVLVYGGDDASMSVVHAIAVGEPPFEDMRCFPFHRGDTVRELYVYEPWLLTLVKNGNEDLPYWVQTKALR